jgi:hypothetical protein
LAGLIDFAEETIFVIKSSRANSGILLKKSGDRMRAQQQKIATPSYCNILFAILGKSPAVLTETVWALALEKPPLIPDRIFVLTTVAGRDVLKQVLFDNGGWFQFMKLLRQKRLDIQSRAIGGISRVFSDWLLHQVRLGFRLDVCKLFLNFNG